MVNNRDNSEVSVSKKIAADVMKESTKNVSTHAKQNQGEMFNAANKNTHSVKMDGNLTPENAIPKKTRGNIIVARDDEDIVDSNYGSDTNEAALTPDAFDDLGSLESSLTPDQSAETLEPSIVLAQATSGTAEEGQNSPVTGSAGTSDNTVVSNNQEADAILEEDPPAAGPLLGLPLALIGGVGAAGAGRRQ